MKCIYSVEEATNKIYAALAENTNWKYIKSQKCLKKTFKDLIFEIDFHSSKWNCSYQSIEINADFYLICKTYGKFRVDNVIACIAYHPEDGYWYDISTTENLELALMDLNNKIQKTAITLYKQFEEDYLKAVNQLFNNHFDAYHVHLDFIADKLGSTVIQEKAQEIYNNLPDEMKFQVLDYKNGSRNMSWMINRCNLKYIVDNDFITI